MALAAVAAAWLAAAGLFWTVGAAGAFLDATLVQLWRWPVRQNPFATLRPTLAADLTLWLATAAAIAATVSPLVRPLQPLSAAPSGRQAGEATALSLSVLICFVVGLLIKAAYAQYYLLWLPLAAVVAANWLVRWTKMVSNSPLSLSETATDEQSPLSLWERARVRAL